MDTCQWEHNKAIGIGFVSIEFHNPFITNWYGILYHKIIVRTKIDINIETHREENGFMDRLKYAVIIEKSIQILRNYYILLMSNQDQLG